MAGKNQQSFIIHLQQERSNLPTKELAFSLIGSIYYTCPSPEQRNDIVVLNQWFSKISPQISNLSFWKSIRNADSQASLQFYWIRNAGGRALQSVLTSLPCALKFEDNCFKLKRIHPWRWGSEGCLSQIVVLLGRRKRKLMPFEIKQCPHPGFFSTILVSNIPFPAVCKMWSSLKWLPQ